MSIKEDIERSVLSFFASKAGKHGKEMIGQMMRECMVLLKQTWGLFLVEYREKLQLLTRDAIVIIIGGAFLWVGLLAFVTTAIIVLAFYVPLWLSALLVCLFFSFLGLALLFSGLANIKRRNMTPQLTIQAIRENAHWLKNKIP